MGYTTQILVKEFKQPPYVITVFASGEWENGQHSVRTVCTNNNRTEWRGFTGSGARSRALTYAKEQLVQLQERAAAIGVVPDSSDIRRIMPKKQPTSLGEAAAMLLQKLADNRKVQAVGTDNVDTIYVYLRQHFNFQLENYAGYKVVAEYVGPAKPL